MAAVTVLPKNRGVGTVDIVAAARGGMPDQALLDALQDYFDGVREIAVDVRVSAPTEVSVELAVALTPAEGYEFQTVSQAVTRAVEDWFTGERLGRPVLQAELTALVFGVEGVANCAVTITGGDVPCSSVTLPQLGQLTVTQV